MSRMARLDETSGLATFGAGVAGPYLEAQLRAHGYTLGHYPQSFDYSTLGGWVATRSSGQQSAYYGRIERLFAGGRMESPSGPLDLPVFPASAAGPDLREMVLGSEGRLGIITEATVRVRRMPEHEAFFGVFFPDWTSGTQAVRAMVQAGLPLSMARLNTAEETRTSLLLAGKPRLTALLRRYLSFRHIGEEGCLAILGVTGHPVHCKTARAEALGCGPRAGRPGCGRDGGTGVEEEPLPRALPPQQPLGGGLRRGHPGDGPALVAHPGGPGGGGGRPAAGPRTARRGGPRHEPPVPRLRRRRQPLHHLSLPAGGPRNDAGAVARAQGRREPGRGGIGRHHQPPARRRHRPRAVPGRREGAPGHGGPGRRDESL